MGTLRLTLLRHGQAQPVDSSQEDYERALTRRGTIEIREMASRLAHRGHVPDLILASPSERTWASASIVAGVCELDARHVMCVRELYLAAAEVIWDLVRRRERSAHHLLVVGHNPGLSERASLLGPNPRPRDLPPAGLATAQWHAAVWTTLQPATASSCELDDPESMADFWA